MRYDDHSAGGIGASRALLWPVSGPVAFALALAIGLAYALILLGPAVAFGSSDFWRLPQGAAGGMIDVRTAMSGYYWSALDLWRWPLFHLPHVNDAGGANAVLVDPVPILALIAKVWRSLTGAVVNLYPIWVTATFALNAAALTMVVRGLGGRSLLMTATAAGIGALAPVIHHRFGHIGHASHWIFVFAFALYASWSRDGIGPRLAGAGLIALCALAFATNIYLYVMTAVIAAAFFVQAACDRRLSWAGSLSGLLGVLTAGLALFWTFGMLGISNLGGTTIPFGQDSMNLLAPFWPQTSGALSWTGLYLLTRGSIGATTGQYEGYCYLGLGALLLVGIALVRRGRMLPGLVRRHWALSLALLALALWAVSNTVYLGPVRVLSYPLPDLLLRTVLAWFRAEGRFFWPVAWLIAALAIAGALSAMQPRRALAVAAVALALQWMDLSIWRTRIGDMVAEGPVSAFGSPALSARLEQAILSQGRVAVVPSMNCNADGGDYDALDSKAAAEVQLLAARGGAEMPAIAMARGGVSCATERATPLRELAGKGLIVVLAQPGDRDRRAEAAESFVCQPVNVGLVCSAEPILNLATRATPD